MNFKTHKLLRLTTLPLAAALMSVVAQQAKAQEQVFPREQELCPNGFRGEHIEVDIFPPKNEQGAYQYPFNASDVSLLVLTNTGNLPARLKVDYYFASCLKMQPQTTDPEVRRRLENQDKPQLADFTCELLESVTADIYPGMQTVNLTNLSNKFFTGTEGRPIAYRVLIDFTQHYGSLYDPSTAQQSSEPGQKPVDYQSLEIFVDFYKNLPVVDCEQTDFVAEFTAETRRPNLIEAVRFATIDETEGLERVLDSMNPSGTVRETDGKGISSPCIRRGATAQFRSLTGRSTDPVNGDDDSAQGIIGPPTPGQPGQDPFEENIAPIVGRITGSPLP